MDNVTPDYLLELLKRAEDPEHPGRDLAIYNMYLAAAKAMNALDLHIERDAAANARAWGAVNKLGALIGSIPPSRKTVPLDAVTNIWRNACHG